MTDVPNPNLELSWALMPPIECSLWGTRLALRAGDPDGGLAAADTAITRLRLVSGVRSRLPESEYEAARANAYIEYEESAVCIPSKFGPGTVLSGSMSLTPEQIDVAYERFNHGRGDFYSIG